jgi:hypothetical protein
MAVKRHKPEEIVAKLRQVEVLVGYAMELDPAYVDTAVCRWERSTGEVDLGRDEKACRRRVHHRQKSSCARMGRNVWPVRR